MAEFQHIFVALRFVAQSTTTLVVVARTPMNAFFAWFQNQNGTIDTTAMRIDDISGSGRGAIAVRDLPVSD